MYEWAHFLLKLLFQFFVIIIHKYRKIWATSSICVNWFLNVYKFSIQKLVELLNAAAARTFSTVWMKIMIMFEIHYNRRKIRQIVTSWARAEATRAGAIRTEAVLAGITRAEAARARVTRTGASSYNYEELENFCSKHFL